MYLQRRAITPKSILPKFRGEFESHGGIVRGTNPKSIFMGTHALSGTHSSRRRVQFEATSVPLSDGEAALSVELTPGDLDEFHMARRATLALCQLPAGFGCGCGPVYRHMAR